MNKCYPSPVCEKDVTIYGVDPLSILGNAVECQSCHAELWVKADVRGLICLSATDEGKDT